MRNNDPMGTDYLVARGLMRDTRPAIDGKPTTQHVPHIQMIGRVSRPPAYRDTRPTAPNGIRYQQGGPVTQAIKFGNALPVRTVQVVDWPAAAILLTLGLALGFLLGWVIM